MAIVEHLCENCGLLIEKHGLCDNCKKYSHVTHTRHRGGKVIGHTKSGKPIYDSETKTENEYRRTLERIYDDLVEIHDHLGIDYGPYDYDSLSPICQITKLSNNLKSNLIKSKPKTKPKIVSSNDFLEELKKI